jgi:hypothetical protein
MASSRIAADYPETVDLIKRLAVYHASRMTLDRVVTAAISEGFVKDGPVPHRRGVIRRHLARADLGGLTIEGL